MGETAVIGFLADTAKYIGKKGYDVLNMPNKYWTPCVNYNWMQDHIDYKDDFLLVTDPGRAYKNVPLVGVPLPNQYFGVEVGQIGQAGYAPIFPWEPGLGQYWLPPAEVV